jgi:hypothetical protein
VVTGTAEIRYRNLRADTLSFFTLSLGHNAFRPGAAAWPVGDSSGRRATGFQRLHDVRLNDLPVIPQWPNSPDSSTARLPLPRPLLPGDSVVLTLAWEARPPSLMWRIERRGRRIDLVAWYPRLMDDGSRTDVPMPALATFELELDLAGDQVIGGTGVPTCGDPGWAAASGPRGEPPELQREWYALAGAPPGPPVSCDGAAPGRKRVTWYAEHVTEVAYALSPTFRYEEGDVRGKRVRALYEKGGERTWGAGLATRRAETALEWTHEVAGQYPWPQLTVVEGLDRSGRALPMLMLADGSGQARILNLMGLMITQQVLPGSQRPLAVGGAAFQAAWFFETLGGRGYYSRIEREILDWDLDGLGRTLEPLPPAGSTSPCTDTFCRRTEFMIHQLRWWAGSDSLLKELFRTHIARYQLQPAVPRSFQRLARELIRPPPDTLLRQLVPGGVLYDDAIASANREPLDDGSWRTTIVLERRGTGIFPRTVWVLAEGDTGRVRAVALTPRETVTVVTRTRPERVVLDPLTQGHDWNMLNNQRVFGFPPASLLLAPHRPSEKYLDTYFSRHSERDRLTRGWAPTAWYNDAGGWTFGARLREDYLGRFELNEGWASLSTGWGTEGIRTDLNGRLRLRNPVWLRAPGWSQVLGVAWVEGRAAAELGLTHQFRKALVDSTTRSLGLGVRWLTVTDSAYLDPGFYDDAGTAELALTGQLASVPGPWPLSLEAELAGGYAYPNADGAPPAGGYGRLTVIGSVRHQVSRVVAFGARLFAGGVWAPDSVPRQRRIYLAGADPYQRFGSPFLRSQGSILTQSSANYHAPGGAGVRGLDPRVSSEQAIGGTIELEYALVPRPVKGLFSRIAIAGFADGGLGNGDLTSGGDRLEAVGDAGVGLRIGHRLGQTTFQTRFDFPLWVSRPPLAQDDDPAEAFGFRWSFSFVPAF